MRYVQSEKSFRQYQPVMPKPKKKGLFAFLKKEKKVNTTPVAFHTNLKPSPRVNPYRREEKVKKGISLRIKLFFLFAILLSWVALAIYLPYFHINKIVYYGLDIIQKEEIENYIKTNYLESWGVLPHNSYFLASTGKITTLLNQKYSLNRLEVRKKFPDTLEVDLEEKMSSVVYDNGEKYFLLDNEGTVLKILGETGEVTPTTTFSTSTISASSTLLTALDITSHKPDYMRIKNSFGNYPVIFDTRYLSITEKEKNVLLPKIIASTIAWRDLLEKEGIAGVKYFITENPLAGLGAVTNKGLTVYYQPDADLNLQLQNLKTILKSEQPQQYVDLRFGERVYWK